MSAIKTEGRLRARYDRLVRRFGGYRNPNAKKKAIFAVAHTLARIIWPPGAGPVGGSPLPVLDRLDEIPGTEPRSSSLNPAWT